MLSLQFIRENTDKVKQMVADRQMSAPIDEIVAADDRRRSIIGENEALKTRRNEVSKQIGRMKDKPELLNETREKMRAVGDQIKVLDEQQRQVEEELDNLLLYVPNMPHETTPVGPTEDENVEVALWGEKPDFTFEPKQHWEIGENLNILDTQRATRMSGTRFVLLRAAGARLERALANFMLDVHTTYHGYTEIAPPYLVEKKAMVGTGQYPKFIETDGAYKIEDEELFLIPTAEVPLTNMLREEILEPGTLPRKFAAHTPSFRKEAGSAGQDTRGLIRVHQFAKVELVRFEQPDQSYDALEQLLEEATDILKRLNLHYRVVLKCTGDLGFTAAKTYDPEVWMPGQQRYREISSVSNFEAFQARRARIQYRPSVGQRVEFPHTLNASGLAVGRTLAAVLENYQQEDGSVIVPEALRPYMGGVERITG